MFALVAAGREPWLEPLRLRPASPKCFFKLRPQANSIDALRAAGEEKLSGKILIDVVNILPPACAGPCRRRNRPDSVEIARPIEVVR
jgi:hypothetical protein